MSPVVTEIVYVDQGFAFRAQNLGKPRFTFVDDVEFVKFVVFGHAPILSILFELVKTTVGPAHRALECVIQTALPDRGWNLDVPPDRWLNADERDLELVDGWRCLCRGHREIVQRFMGQAHGC